MTSLFLLLLPLLITCKPHEDYEYEYEDEGGDEEEVISYLIFVISFTQAGFFNPKFLHPKTMQNTQKFQQIPPKSVKYAVFCVQSGKFYTGQIFFTRALPVVPATNMRYAGQKWMYTKLSADENNH